MYDLNKFKINTLEDTDVLGRFEIGPFPKGFGHTVGNAIRRILMTSISGAAVTGVKIKGIKHEYTTFEGMQDDVITFILNLKNIALLSHAEGPVTLKLSKKGKKDEVVEVKASDFEKNSDIEITNPDLVLTELTKPSAELEVEVIVERGVGYSLPDESKRAEIGVIPVDSLFSPVKHVKMDIVSTRVGQQTDLDQINLEVHSNGANKPTTMLLEAIEIFDLIANRLVDMAGGNSDENSLQVVGEEEEESEEKKILVSDMNLSTRLTNALLNTGISDLNTLEGRARNEVMNFKGMGKKSYKELEEILNEYNINLS